MDPTQTAVLDDRYELIELVGVGGVAEVWRALDNRLGREVAVKILSGPAARDPEHRRRIEREARALAAVAHPNVVAVFDYGEQDTAATDPVPYIVLELVAGPDLARKLTDDGPLEVGEAVAMMQQVLAGIEQAHQLGIVHGDLKPANVFLSPDGPKVGDFGVARILSEETGTTAVAATPAYAAPEVLRGARPTSAADVYSAACIAFEVLCGRPPFIGRNYWELYRQHTEEDAPSVRSIRPDIPDGLDAAIAAALDKDPARRPPSAEALALSLLPGPASEDDAVPAVPLTEEPRTEETVTEQAPPPDEGPAAPTVRVRRERTEVLPLRPRRRSRAIGILRRVPPGLAIALGAVMLLVSQATAKVAVPDLTGRPFEEAAAMAADAGLVVTRNDVPGPGVAGTVVSQSPAVQTRLGRGDPVALTVTQGVPQVEVPPVVGRSTDEAVQILQQAGLGYEASYVPSTEVEPMTVVKTTPEAGARVDHGTAVNLDIALAPAQPAENTSPQSDRGPGRGRGREDRDDD